MVSVPGKEIGVVKVVAFLTLLVLAGCASVKRGEALFMAETFDGNGRTCATCHTPDESFSISQATIQMLPRDNSLFVSVPGLEDQNKLFHDGLVFVNDPDDGIVEFRQTPKLTHLRTSCNRKGRCGPLGLRGDRERDLCKFSNEAIGNHFTKRVPGVADVDFRLMTKKECVDMVAFLVSQKVADSGQEGN